MSRANKQVVFLGYVQLIVIGRTIRAGSFQRVVNPNNNTGQQAKIAYLFQVPQIPKDSLAVSSSATRPADKHRKTATSNTCSSVCVSFLEYSHCVTPMCVYRGHRHQTVTTPSVPPFW